MPRWFGIAAPGLTRETTALDQITTAVGHPPTVANWYDSWGCKQWNGTSWGLRPFPVAEAERLRLWGATPQVTWEPWDPNLGHNQPKYKLTEIAAGAHDAYITLWAQGIASWGYPLRLRFAHEMNYGSYPWCVGRNGNTPSDHIAAWLHVREIFSDAGATNVRWVWSVQTPFPGTTSIDALFPGDYAVDEIALDGYNWALTNPWNSFTGVFKRGIAELTPLTSRPVTIGETGCPETGGDKAAWIRDMWIQLAAWPQVKGLLWFNFNKEADWRIDSTPASLEAFKAGLPAFTA